MSVSARWGEIAARVDLTRGHRAPTKSAALMLVLDASTPSFIHPTTVPIVLAASNPVQPRCDGTNGLTAGRGTGYHGRQLCVVTGLQQGWKNLGF